MSETEVSIPDGSADQILIRWSERTLTGGSGVGPTAASLRDHADLVRWERRLLAGDWAAAEATGEPGRPALLYLRFGEEAAVLRKDVVRDARGRTGAPNTHVLVGSYSLLNTQMALGLHDWTGWIDEESSPAELGRVDGSRLRNAARAGYQELRARSRTISPRVFGALIATVLSAPDARISAYLPDDADEVGDMVPALELICGLLDVLGPAVARDWTFSTGEKEEPASDVRPALVFLTRPPQFSTRAQTGHRIRIGQAAWLGSPSGTSQDINDLTAFGMALADAYHFGGPGGLAKIKPSVPFATTREALEWAARVQLAPGVIDDVGILLHEIGLGRDAAAAAARDRPLSYFTDGLAELPGKAFATLANCWGPEDPATLRYPALGQAICDAAAWRYLTADLPGDSWAGSGQTSDGRLARDVVIALGVPVTTWIAQLGRYLSESSVAERDTVIQVIQRAAERVPAGDELELARALDILPFADLLDLAAGYVGSRPSLSESLLRVAAARGPVTDSDRTEIWHWLGPPGRLAELAEQCRAGAPEAGAELLTEVLRGTLGSYLDKPGVATALVDQVSGVDSAVLLGAVAAVVPPEQQLRILSIAGHWWFESRGIFLADVSTPPLPVVVPTSFTAPDDSEALTGAAPAAGQAPGATSDPGPPGTPDSGTSPVVPGDGVAAPSDKPGPRWWQPTARSGRWRGGHRRRNRRRYKAVAQRRSSSRNILVGLVLVLAILVAVAAVIAIVLILLKEPL